MEVATEEGVVSENCCGRRNGTRSHPIRAMRERLHEGFVDVGRRKVGAGGRRIADQLHAFGGGGDRHERRRTGRVRGGGWKQRSGIETELGTGEARASDIDSALPGA